MKRFEQNAIDSLVYELARCPTCVKLLCAQQLPDDFDAIAVFLNDLLDAHEDHRHYRLRR